jgi:Domain of unknown function (DUF4157)
MFAAKENIAKSNAGFHNLPTAFFQPKLSINQPTDVYEQEADAMADKAMRMVDADHTKQQFFKPTLTPVQRKCKDCEEEEKLQRKENSESKVQGNNELDNYVGYLSSSGHGLPGNVRQFFEPRFGNDFSNVRIHTDSVAAKSAQSINALAYTTGNNIVFNSGQYSPDSDSGKKLLAHELTHVVQQKGGADKSVQRDTIAKGKGYDPDQTIVNDKDMPNAIELMIEASPTLKPYLDPKAPNIDDKGAFKVKIGYANLLIAYKDCYGHEYSGDGEIGGFYCRKDGNIYMVAGQNKERTSTLGDAVHESIHKKSKYTLGPKFTDYINEGVTQYFADRVLNDQGLPDYKGHKYQDQLACAKDLISVAGIDEVAKEYFQGKSNLATVLHDKFSAELAAAHFNTVISFLHPSPQTFCKMLNEKSKNP